MRRVFAMMAVGACIAIAVVGCCIGDMVFPIGGVNIDTGKIGTGEPAFQPRDDENYDRGQRTNDRNKGWTEF